MSLFGSLIASTSGAVPRLAWARRSYHAANLEASLLAFSMLAAIAANSSNHHRFPLPRHPSLLPHDVPGPAGRGMRLHPSVFRLPPSCCCPALKCWWWLRLPRDGDSISLAGSRLLAAHKRRGELAQPRRAARPSA